MYFFIFPTRFECTSSGRFSFAALIASFCDKVLKRTSERTAEDQIETTLTKIVKLHSKRVEKMIKYTRNECRSDQVDLFSFLTEKDSFAEIYRCQLAKRLLQESSAGDDLEKSLIQKLKLKCGAQFTCKLEGMITDLNLGENYTRNGWRRCEIYTRFECSFFSH